MNSRIPIIPLLVFFIVSACSPSASIDELEYGPLTKDLIEIVENDAEIKSLLEASLAKAKEINPDKVTNPAQSIEEYYEFISWAEKAMPWDLRENPGSMGLQYDILASLGYFYFLNDQKRQNDTESQYHFPAYLTKSDHVYKKIFPTTF